MKKALLAIVLLLGLFFAFPLTETHADPAMVATDTMVIHYYRYAGDYDTGWNMWLWPAGGAGAAFNFDTVGEDIVTDGYGAVFTLDLTAAPFVGVSSIGILIRKGDWIQKDVASDRFIAVPATSEDGILHVYFVQGDPAIGYSIDDPDGPDKSDKVFSAFFTGPRTIAYSLTAIVGEPAIDLLKDDVSIPHTIVLDNNAGVITLSSDVVLTSTYTLSVTFGTGLKTYDVTFDGIYDTPEFEAAFGYEGNDLGAVVTGSSTAFRLWAPIASAVTLNIYASGTPASLIAKDATATDTPLSTLAMTKSEKGTWTYSVNENWHGKYYTYTVTNGTNTNEVVDPYAKSTGVNGVRGMIVDFSQTNPSGFAYDDRPDTVTNYTDAIIYETHVRDLTTHSSWIVDEQYESYRGKFLGFTVRGTTYEGVTTGIDHIIELGVTHVQILPFFDYGNAVDESGSATQFNWGYMPLNFNTLEGYYSTNPYDGTVRINEFKQLMTTMTDNDLRVIMDVVYNHTGQSADSNFNLILPGYYHRLNPDGSFSNGSGTGNETASERFMMQKFIVDSVCFWASEYNISGFRFDLMALHDTETMNAVAAALHEIDETIIVFGEPWTGGTSQLDSAIAADKVNLVDIPHVAAFNDEMRNGTKGSVFNALEGGFVQGNLTEVTLNQVKYGIVGGVEFPGIDGSVLSYEMFWGNNPSQVINYAAAHDNNTLYDKLKLSAGPKTATEIAQMSKQANAMVLLAEGIPFLLSGDEFLRSKPNASGVGYDSNSYASPDSTNQLRWDLKAQTLNMEVFEYYKDLIALRKNHPAFRLSTAAEVLAAVDFIDYGKDSVIAYTISGYANNDSWDTILVIHNAGLLTQLALPEGEWYLVGNKTGVDENIIKTYAAGSSVPVRTNETVILYTGIVHETVIPEEPTGLATWQIVLISVSSVATVGVGVLVFFLLRKRFIKIA